MRTDHLYQKTIKSVINLGDNILTRNHAALSLINAEPLIFTSTPLVTIRKTAWKMALREMQWFMSGEQKCPKELLPWWSKQLNHDGNYIGGYSEQFRRVYCGDDNNRFDQIQYILDGLKNNPNSRRLVLTTWNPYDMAYITALNDNPNAVTCCHSTIIQFFVRDRTLHMTSYQRSADLLLGVPHNWIQSWALLLWLAYHARIKVGTLRWIFGDLHIYHHQSHIDTAYQIMNNKINWCNKNTFNLEYQPKNDDEVFLAEDFIMTGVIPEPKVFLKPELF